MMAIDIDLDFGGFMPYSLRYTNGAESYMLLSPGWWRHTLEPGVYDLVLTVLGTCAAEVWVNTGGKNTVVCQIAADSAGGWRSSTPVTVASDGNTYLAVTTSPRPNTLQAGSVVAALKIIPIPEQTP